MQPQELDWDNFSPTSSYQEYTSIVKEALDQLHIEEEERPRLESSEQDDVFINHQQLPLDDNLPGSALNASTSTHNISVDSLSAIPTIQEPIMTEEATRLIMEYDECVMIDEDCQGIITNPDRFSIDKLDKSLDLLEEKASSLRHIIAYFRNNPDPRISQTGMDAALNLRKEMRSKIEFIHEHRTNRLNKQATQPPTRLSEPLSTILEETTAPSSVILTGVNGKSADTTPMVTPATTLPQPQTNQPNRINLTTYAVIKQE